MNKNPAHPYQPTSNIWSLPSYPHLLLTLMFSVYYFICIVSFCPLSLFIIIIPTVATLLPPHLVVNPLVKIYTPFHVITHWPLHTFTSIVDPHMPPTMSQLVLVISMIHLLYYTVTRSIFFTLRTMFWLLSSMLCNFKQYNICGQCSLSFAPLYHICLVSYMFTVLYWYTYNPHSSKICSFYSITNII